MEQLFVVGAGGFGREVYRYAVDCRLSEDIGFLDDNPQALADTPLASRWRGSIAGWKVKASERFLIAVGFPAVRRALHAALAQRGANFASLVHPTAYVAPGARLGAGSVVGPFAFVGPEAEVGEHAVLNTYASMGHDSKLGAFGVLSPYAVLNGNAQCDVDVFLGTHATVTPGRTVGRGARIGAGAVVLKNVPEGVLAVGSPAVARPL